MHIHVDWTGPHNYEEALRLRDTDVDYGLYQIYGAHPVYGTDVLIYIGKAVQQTIGKRLSQESWNYHNQDCSRLRVYVGRLGGYEGTPTDDEWTDQLTKVERLLIYSHWPAGNSSGLNMQFGEDLYDTHILNWGTYCSLLPEVSGMRYSNRYSSSDNYETFGRKPTSLYTSPDCGPAGVKTRLHSMT